MPFQFRKEAIEEDLNTNFPSQGQGNPPLYYSLSEVVVPTYSINNVAEGTSLPEILQTAWDFSTGANQVNNADTLLASTAGFYKVDLVAAFELDGTGAVFSGRVYIDDGITEKNVWGVSNFTAGSITDTGGVVQNDQFVVFLRSGDQLRCEANGTACTVDIVYRQIATANGQLINPLGFSFA